MLPLILRPEAREEFDDATQWQERQRAGLGTRFVQSVEETLHRIAVNPHLYAVIYKDVRHTLVRGFPYVVYYRAHPDHVEVIAIYHGRRATWGWKSRA